MFSSLPEYIVLEGPTCAGKGTQQERLAHYLGELGISVVTTREPGGPDEAEAIREQIFRMRSLGELTAEDEIRMFYVAREINMYWVEEGEGREVVGYGPRKEYE